MPKKKYQTTPKLPKTTKSQPTGLNPQANPPRPDKRLLGASDRSGAAGASRSPPRPSVLPGAGGPSVLFFCLGGCGCFFACGSNVGWRAGRDLRMCLDNFEG